MIILSEKFQKRVENFQCSNCGFKVTGNGFTDHCPKCLFGRHVDINPGDRAALKICGGEMEPISIAPNGKRFSISYICKKCGYKYTNKSSDDDDITSFIETLNGAESISKRLPPT